MSIKADSEIDRIESALGVGGNVEIVPILIPMSTYQLLLNAGKERGLSVSDVIARSIELYLQPKPDIENTEQHEPRHVTFRRPRK